jgi:hypothetical protein
MKKYIITEEQLKALEDKAKTLTVLSNEDVEIHAIGIRVILKLIENSQEIK